MGEDVAKGADETVTMFGYEYAGAVSTQEAKVLDQHVAADEAHSSARGIITASERQIVARKLELASIQVSNCSPLIIL